MFVSKGTFILEMSAYLFQKHLHFNRNLQKQKSKEFLMGKSQEKVMGQFQVWHFVSSRSTDQRVTISCKRPALAISQSPKKCRVVISTVGLINQRLWLEPDFWTNSLLYQNDIFPSFFFFLGQVYLTQNNKLVMYQNVTLLLKFMQM